MNDLFELPQQFTLRQQIACVQREIVQRRRVYKSLVFRGRMSEAEAEMEIACMEQVSRTLRALVNDGK
jgi:hypothetical protein